MPKSKQTKSSKIKVTRKAIIIAACVFVVCLALSFVFFLFKNHSQEGAVKEQKSVLIQSQAEVRDVYYEFADTVSYPKEYSKTPVNECSKTGAKYVTEYSCGNNSILKINNIDEQAYRTINTEFNNKYLDNKSFKSVSIEQPINLSYTKGIGGSVSSIFKDSNIKCYGSSTYDTNKRSATFGLGCGTITKQEIFPLAD